MKKVVLVLMFAALLIPTACSSNSSGNSSSGASSGESPQVISFGTSTSTSTSSSSLLSDTITLPASMFKGQDFDDIKSNAQKSGVEDVTKNKDGSITYKMSQATHQRLIVDTKQETIKALRKFKNSIDFPFIKDILLNDDFSEITLVIDKSQYDNACEYDNACDSTLLFDIGTQVHFYQIINGVKSESVKSTIKYRDQKTNQIFKTSIYPNDLNSSSK